MDETTSGGQWHWDGAQWLWWNGQEWVPATATTPPEPPPAEPPAASTPPSSPPPVPPVQAPPTAAVPPPPPNATAPAPPAATAPPPSQVASPAKRGLGAGWIAAIAIGAVLVLVIVGAGAGFFFLRDTDSSDVVTIQTEPLSTSVAPFTASVGIDTPVTPPPAPATASATAATTQVAPADTVGLYGGTLNQGTCDKAQLVAFLQENPDKAAAWAQAVGITAEAIPAFVAPLTPVLLRSDTLVTNHGFENGKLTTFPALLQAGTAVMVNDRGAPVVKCNCGNPLTPPPATLTKAKYKGPTWPEFKPGVMTVVEPSTTVITNFVLVNVTNNEMFVRPVATDGQQDTPGSEPPTTPAPQDTAVPTDPATPAAPAAPAEDQSAAAIELAKGWMQAAADSQGRPIEWSAFSFSAAPTGSGTYDVTVTDTTGDFFILSINVSSGEVTAKQAPS